MIERILPDKAAVSWSVEDAPESVLLPEEAARISGAVVERRREFATVRHCAREALGILGVAPVALLPGPQGEPRWPDGVVGSMTHCAGYRAAAVAPAAELRSLGIDAEPDLPLPDGVFDAIACSEERARMARMSGAAHPDRLLFSAKESVYKAWFPLTRRPLDFSEASLVFTCDGTFAAHLLVPGPEHAGGRLQMFHGRWAATAGLLLTSVVIGHPIGAGI
ncbi:4'-phosphopantetheinyl transferase family protein [Streptomyces sp. NBC_00328]|uniref:4'-phosphopantetheinyl transferase family protein n=1 Tax=Streptomyces sp. NBC_00328 TaxID=2903646 RepID=UPI002E289E65|nr:4'-phosphopantetheinyl transferase superfamily protein [Streptomyces sp. NBC_00328]